MKNLTELLQVERGVGSFSSRYGYSLITESQTWIAPWDMKIRIHVIGAGGGSRTDRNTYHAGGGGYVRKTLVVPAGTELVCSIGAKGVQGTSPTDGGDTTVTGGGLNLVAGGGRAAAYTSQGPGGTASGGDINRPGERGATLNADSGGCCKVFDQSSGYLLFGSDSRMGLGTIVEGMDIHRFYFAFGPLFSGISDFPTLYYGDKGKAEVPFAGSYLHICYSTMGGGGCAYSSQVADGGPGGVFIEYLRGDE